MTSGYPISSRGLPAKPAASAALMFVRISIGRKRPAQRGRRCWWLIRDGCPCRKPYPAWQSIENRTMIVRNEGSLQAHWLDGCRSDPVAGNASGRDLDVAAADQRSAANCSKETLLLRRRPNDIRRSLPVVLPRGRQYRIAKPSQNSRKTTNASERIGWRGRLSWRGSEKGFCESGTLRRQCRRGMVDAPRHWRRLKRRRTRDWATNIRTRELRLSTMDTRRRW